MENLDGYKWLKFLCELEKKFNVSRNFLFQSKRRRFIQTFLILIDILMSIVYVIDSIISTELVWFRRPDLQYGTVLNHLTTIVLNVLFISYFAPVHGELFRKLLININRCHQMLEIVPGYQKSVFKVNVTCAILTITFAVTVTILNLNRLLFLVLQMDMVTHYFGVIFNCLFKLIIELRFSLELMVYSTLLMVIHNLLRSLNNLMKCNNTITAENIEMYVLLYQRVLESGKLIKACFSNQV